MAFNSTSSSVLFQSFGDEYDEYTISVQDYNVPSTIPIDFPEDSSATHFDSLVIVDQSSQLWERDLDAFLSLSALRDLGSDSGSDCQSIRSCPSSPSLSPLLTAYDGFELESSVEELSLESENQRHHGTSSFSSPYTPDFQGTISLPFTGLLSTASLSRSEDSESSCYYPSSPTSVYPSSPRFSSSPSPQSQSPGNTSHYSSLPHSPQLPFLNVDASACSLLLQSPQPTSLDVNSSRHYALSDSTHHLQSPSTNSNVLLHAMDPLNSPNSHYNQSLGIPTSGCFNTFPGTPFLDSSHSPSSSSEDILPTTPFEGLPYPWPYYDQSRPCKQEPITHSVANPASTSSDIVSEIFGCVDGGSSSKDATEIKRKVMSTLGLSLEDQDAKRFFGKPAKNSVSSPAGRQASQKRRVHPAKWNCPICGDNFTRNAGLKNHLKSHVGVTDYECQYCHNVFNTSLSRHEERCNMNPAKVKTPRKKIATQKTTDGFEMLETPPFYAKSPY